jgi:hypothetical protein
LPSATVSSKFFAVRCVTGLALAAPRHAAIARTTATFIVEANFSIGRWRRR